MTPIGIYDDTYEYLKQVCEWNDLTTYEVMDMLVEEYLEEVCYKNGWEYPYDLNESTQVDVYDDYADLINKICEINDITEYEVTDALVYDYLDKLCDSNSWATPANFKYESVKLEEDYDNQDVYYWNGKDKVPDDVVSVVIEDGVTEIGDYAFYMHFGLQSVTIPNSVTEIGREAFSSCHSLQSITISDSIVSIGNSAFSYCKSLKSINIPDSVTEIGKGAFSYCKSLVKVNVSSSITYINDFTFSNCESLRSINIPNGVTKIGRDAFEECKSLKSINIPNSVIEIDDNAFSYCKSLKSINLSNSLNEINFSTFHECKKLESIIIPDGVTKIDNCAFRKCYNLKNVNLPDSVTKIGKEAFIDCKSLTQINISDNIDIDPSAFLGCDSLESSEFAKYMIDPDAKKSNTKHNIDPGIKGDYDVNVKLGDVIEELEYDNRYDYSFPGAQWVIDELDFNNDYCHLLPYNRKAKSAMKEMREAGDIEDGEKGIVLGTDQDEFFGAWKKVASKTNESINVRQSIKEDRVRINKDIHYMNAPKGKGSKVWSPDEKYYTDKGFTIHDDKVYIPVGEYEYIDTDHDIQKIKMKDDRWYPFILDKDDDSMELKTVESHDSIKLDL